MGGDNGKFWPKVEGKKNQLDKPIKDKELHKFYGYTNY
jgi:hypothetical protein